MKCYTKHITGKGNPFYGKTHTKETKRKIGAKNSVYMKGENNPMNKKNVFEWMIDKHGYDKAKQLWDKKNKKFGELHTGKNNPFYGKTHSEESINKIIKGNEIARMNPEFTKSHSEACSIAQHKIKNRNPIAYSEMKRKAGMVSNLKQSKYKMNTPERKFADFLKLNKIEYVYSSIMSKFQYDFKIKNERILIEVDGDYWHGNPNLYKSFNDIQLKMKCRDKEKEEFAKAHNFKLLRIWVSELDNEDKLQGILNEISS